MPYRLRKAARLQFVAEFARAAALPHYCVIYRLSRLPVPYYCCLALVGYAYGGYVLRPYAKLLHRFHRNAQLRGPYFVGIMLNIAAFGVYLRKLLLRYGAHARIAVKQYAAVGRCARVQRHNIFCHAKCPPLLIPIYYSRHGPCVKDAAQKRSASAEHNSFI